MAVPLIVGGLLGVNRTTKETAVTASPGAIKIMLYELFTLALAKGQISDMEQRLLDAFKQRFGIDDLTFDEIRERAESMHRETQKTLALVLE